MTEEVLAPWPLVLDIPVLVFRLNIIVIDIITFLFFLLLPSLYFILLVLCAFFVTPQIQLTVIGISGGLGRPVL